ncbi:MAG: hypothetical protein R2848_18130 [Thermomicrobiales bacterium]
MREFGLEQLEATGDSDVFLRRHALAFLRLAEKTDEYIWGPEAYRWVRRLGSGERQHPAWRWNGPLPTSLRWRCVWLGNLVVLANARAT